MLYRSQITELSRFQLLIDEDYDNHIWVTSLSPIRCRCPLKRIDNYYDAVESETLPLEMELFICGYAIENFLDFNLNGDHWRK